MAQTTFDGPIISRNGGYAAGSGAVVNITAGLTLTPEDHAGRLLRVNLASGTIKLPTINASAYPSSSGPGADPNTLNNQGTTYTFFVQTAATALVIQSNTAANLMYGSVYIGINNTALSASTNIGSIFVPNGSSNYILTMNGTTKGGLAGSLIRATVVSANTYLIQGTLIATDSTLVTPFSG